MSWNGSTRGRATSTAAWQKLRLVILERDEHRCHMCGGLGADAVDHLVPVSRGGTDHPSNLAAVHDRVAPHCHRKKTSAESQQARGVGASRRRPKEQHPGLIEPDDVA